MKILIVFILFAMLLSANFLLRKSKRKLKYKPGIVESVIGLLPVFELVIWTIFTLWAFNFLFRGTEVQFYVNILLVTLSFVLAYRYFIQDYICGVQIKTRFRLSPGQSFKSVQTKGSIRKVGVLVLELKTENGSNFKIPYSQIDQKSVEMNFEEKRGGESTFRIELDNKMSESSVKQKITQIILNSPWSSYKSEPVIKVISDDFKQKTYEISCVTVAENGSSRLKELIVAEFSGAKSKQKN